MTRKFITGLQMHLILLAVCPEKTFDDVIVLSLLNELPEIFEQSLGEFSEENIKNNFVLLYQLVEELIDDGMIQVTDSVVLKKFINQSKETSNVVSSVLNTSVPWRTTGIVHRKNELFIDVIEKVDTLLSADGSVIQIQVGGSILLKSYLSGMPELQLVLAVSKHVTSPTMIKSNRPSKNTEMVVVNDISKINVLEDLRFHQCVRLNYFTTKKIISFIPPDGEFELLKYEINKCHVNSPLFSVVINIPEKHLDPEVATHTADSKQA
uniref:AP-1 complex subunit mu-2-like n=1 Tax=Dermatophagoides pteronyssinus TaxID=6956 RepID=A0A6P6XMA9_DERPT|nr:AP-1 complex subunit mu-2-like [Dermatophagoides pteronyssinus]